MRISDWSSDVCSSDLRPIDDFLLGRPSSRLVGISGTGRLLKIGIVVAVVGAGSVGWYLHAEHQRALEEQVRIAEALRLAEERSRAAATARSEEHTSELQSLMRISYAVFCLKKKIRQKRDILPYE